MLHSYAVITEDSSAVKGLNCIEKQCAIKNSKKMVQPFSDNYSSSIVAEKCLFGVNHKLTLLHYFLE